MARFAEKIIQEKRIVPVVKIENGKDAVLLAEALLRGGLPLAEITFRTEAAEEAIRAIKEQCPEMVCGAGTVINRNQAQKAIQAGAEFLVSPGFSREVIEYAQEQGLPVFPGCCTPAEIMAAMEYGIRAVKFFPARQYGGLDTIKALAAAFPGVQFMPTGGVNRDNLKAYLSFDRVFACGGSWITEGKLMREGRFDCIEELAREAVKLASEA